ncbi:hypothetical protein OIDMADRAFT_17462 [Oidiodendron maius Zn]|uniref:Uncharacterized protein n=1 Tax=Oidiodendron maius (strain Zn) TaxID=913774 RepID=A0A0C3HMV5_OIDMZ|nr:hypothetical protein OIDMADRAFT_17462 [Oidiodendron maius Zn]
MLKKTPTGTWMPAWGTRVHSHSIMAPDVLLHGPACYLSDLSLAHWSVLNHLVGSSRGFVRRNSDCRCPDERQ